MAKIIKNTLNKMATPTKDTGSKHPKAKDFMQSLKKWITSPEGIITLVLFAAAIWYVHHKTAPKGAKA